LFFVPNLLSRFLHSATVLLPMLVLLIAEIAAWLSLLIKILVLHNHVEISIMDKQKEYFRGMEIPKTKKELQSLLGVANWISKYIPSYATIIMPLISALTDRGIKTNKFGPKSKRDFFLF
jgi:hypothetical protein